MPSRDRLNRPIASSLIPAACLCIVRWAGAAPPGDQDRMRPEEPHAHPESAAKSPDLRRRSRSPGAVPGPAGGLRRTAGEVDRHARLRHGGGREVVGGGHQPVASHAPRRVERAVRCRPLRRHPRQPGPTAPSLVDGSLRLVRGALPPRDPGRDRRRGLGSGPDRGRAGGDHPPRGRPPGRRALLPAVGPDPGRGALRPPPVQHLDRADLRPEPGGHPGLRPGHRRARLHPRGPDDRRGLVRGVRALRLPPRALPRPEGDDGRAPRHGLQGDALGLPLHPSRRAVLQGALPQRGRGGLAPERHQPALPRHHAVVGRLQRRHRPHQPPRPGLVQGPARPPRRGVWGRRVQARRGRRGPLHARADAERGAWPSTPTPRPNRHTEAFAEIGLDYPLNEYRATWKMGGQPLAQRLRDKEHTWEDLRKLSRASSTRGSWVTPSTART